MQAQCLGQCADRLGVAKTVDSKSRKRAAGAFLVSNSCHDTVWTVGEYDR